MQQALTPTFNKSLRIKYIFAHFVLFIVIPLIIYLCERPRFNLKELKVVCIILSIYMLIGTMWYLLSKNTYKGTTFYIKENSIVQHQTFFCEYLKEINLENIKEIILSRGPLQRRAGLGTVTLHTQASSPGSNVGSGMRLFDLPKSQEIYEMLKKKIGQ